MVKIGGYGVRVRVLRVILMVVWSGGGVIALLHGGLRFKID